MEEKLVIKDFKTIGGNHCQTTALQHLLNHRKLKISEDMLLGLGGGIGFIYWYMKLMPAPFVGGRNGNVEEFILNAVNGIGGKAEIFQTTSQKKGYEELKNILRNGDPAYVFVDMAYLTYLALPDNAHFGGHTVAVFGIDEQENRVYVADRGKFPFYISVDSLKKAMSSKFPPFAAKNKILKIQYPSKITNLEERIKDSIRNCCRSALHPPIKNFGLQGMKKWAGLVEKWPAQFQGMNLLGALFNVFIYIEIGGTGGSAFRPMYSRFLSESAELLNLPELRDIAGIFERSAVIWTEIANAALPDSWNTLRKIKEEILEKNRIFETEDAYSIAKLVDINKKMDALMSKSIEELDREKNTRLPDLLSDLRQKILACKTIEEKGFLELEKIFPVSSALKSK